MSNGEKQLIHVLLIIIALASLILVVRIKFTPQYDPEIYKRVYSEYENILEVSQETETNEESNVNTTDENYTNDNENDTYDADNIITNDENTTYRVSGITSENTIYTVDGKIAIPKIKVTYPIINETNDEYLKIAPTKLAGPQMHEVGNYCIAGHNYDNNQFFSKLSQLEINDRVYLTSKSGKKMVYLVYDKYSVNEDDLSCLDQDTNGRIESTLITCINSQKQKRLVVKCRMLS